MIIIDMKIACTSTLEQHTDAITSLHMVRNKAVSGSADGTMCLWNVKKGTHLKTFKMVVGNSQIKANIWNVRMNVQHTIVINSISSMNVVQVHNTYPLYSYCLN